MISLQENRKQCHSCNTDRLKEDMYKEKKCDFIWATRSSGREWTLEGSSLWFEMVGGGNRVDERTVGS